MNWNYATNDINENSLNIDTHKFISGCDISKIYNNYHICVGIFMDQ